MILRAGNASLRLENGELRALKIGEIEVLSRWHAPVRDRNWGTLAPQISDEEIFDGGDHFRVRFVATHRENDLHFVWRGEISGARDGTIQFSLDGQAQTSFLKNRIGFCLLHPMSVAGARVQLEKADDGETESGRFPISLAPHQPFLDLRGLAHEVAPNFWAHLEFEGEIFETEDQRNWTDASFKTYCTPLSRPFPVQIAAGERIFQRVTLRFRGDWPAPRPSDFKAPISLSLGEKTVRKPQFGLALPDDLGAFPQNLAPFLARLRPTHLRFETDFSGDFSARIARAAEAAQLLDCPLEIALVWGENSDESALRGAARALEFSPISGVTVFGERVGAISAARFSRAQATLQTALPNAAIGAGSNANFVELNRQPAPRAADFVVYAANPQVHAFDDESILETPPALAQTLARARELANGRGVKISPLTLKPRFNAVATSQTPLETDPNARPENADARQKTVFAATWALASLAELAKNGFWTHPDDALTLCETHGWRGVLDENGRFPLWFLLEKLASWGAECRVVQTAPEARIFGLAHRFSGEILLANGRDFEQRVCFSSAIRAVFSLGNEGWKPIFAEENEVNLPPYSVILVGN